MPKLHTLTDFLTHEAELNQALASVISYEDNILSPILWRQTLSIFIEGAIRADTEGIFLDSENSVAIHIFGSYLIAFLRLGNRINSPFKDSDGDLIEVNGQDLNFSPDSESFDYRLFKCTHDDWQAMITDGFRNLIANGWQITLR